jgi:hypothetical protein
LITARYFSSCPSDSTSRWTPCPPESYQLLSGQRGITPAFGYGAPHPGARGTSTLLNNVLLSTHYEPVRLPTRPPRGYLFPQGVGSRRLAGSPRFLGRSVLARRLLPPRKVRRVLLPVASPSISGFTTLWRAGHLPLPNEAEMSSLALRLTSSPRQGFAREDCSHLRLPGYLLNG